MRLRLPHHLAVWFVLRSLGKERFPLCPLKKLTEGIVSSCPTPQGRHIIASTH
jgi:hypothetical protein